jgi:hypothetical protein
MEVVDAEEHRSLLAHVGGQPVETVKGRERALGEGLAGPLARPLANRKKVNRALAHHDLGVPRSGQRCVHRDRGRAQLTRLRVSTSMQRRSWVSRPSLSDLMSSCQ